jgi:3-hydroxy-9,10-secoandrosta-1,3,5(10)-triene-9,17-dione monooxygenase reductase component
MPESTMDTRDFRNALGSFATGVAVITACGPDGRRVGLTANSFSSVSLDPPQVLWSLASGASSRPVFLAATHFAVHVLAEHQRHLSAQFVSRDSDRFARLAVRQGLGNAPLIDEVAVLFECRRRFTYASGDHLIFIGEVERYTHTDQRPLVFHRGRYAALNAVEQI